MSRQSVSMIFVSLFVGLSLVSLAPSFTAPAAADPSCTRQPLNMFTTNLHAGSNVFDCLDINLKDSLTIGAGQSVKFNNSILRFAGGAGQQISVNSGGRLDIVNASVVLSPSQTAPGVRISYGAGALGRIEDATLQKIALLRVAADGVEVRKSTISDYVSAGLTVADATTKIQDLTITDGPIGVDVQGAARLTATGVTATADLIGLSVGSGARVLAEESVWASENIGLFATGQSRVSHANGSFLDAPVHARLEPSGGHSPVVYLNGTSHDASRFQMLGASQVHALWYARIKVLPDPSVSPPAEAGGAQIAVVNKTNVVRHTVVADATGLSPVLGLPAYSRTGAGVLTEHNPYELQVRAAQGSSANTTSVSVTSNRLPPNTIPVLLPHDEDDEAPGWEDTPGLTSTAAGFSKDGKIELTWNAATDGDLANRKVRHYEVYQIGGSGSAIHIATLPQFAVQGLGNGSYEFRVRPVDLSLNAGEFSNAHVVLVDRQLPVLNISMTPAAGAKFGHHNTSFVVRLGATDTLSGLKKLENKTDGRDANFAPYKTPIPFTQEGEYVLTVRATDNASGVREERLTLVLDKRTPSIAIQLTPPSPGPSGWYTSKPKLTIVAEDIGPSGVHEVRYRLGTAGAWATYEEPVTLDTFGDHVLWVDAIDGAGNRATTSLRVPIDTKAPSVKVGVTPLKGPSGWMNQAGQATVTVTDDASGLDALEYRMGNGLWAPFQSPLALDHRGQRALGVRAVDRAGNVAEEQRVDVNIDPDPPTPPEVRWIADTNGTGLVRAFWADTPPVDLISGVQRGFIEQRREGETGNRSFEIDVRKGEARIGPLVGGRHQLRFRVQDTAGNSATTPWTEMMLSGGASSLALEGQDRIVRGTVTLRPDPLTATEAAEVSYYIDGELVAASAQAPFTYSWNTKGLPDGDHSVRVVVKDATGKEYEQEQVFTVHNSFAHVVGDNIVPFLTLVVLGIASMALSIVGIVRARRRAA